VTTTRARRAALALLAGYAALYALAAAWHRLRPGPDPHAVLRDESRCDECHLTPPARGGPYRQMTFRADIYTLCTRCHPRKVSHPVEIAPGRPLAAALPLDPDGTMTCVTCHAPHAPALSSRIHVGRSAYQRVRDLFFPGLARRYRTYFLRMPTPEGELCRACHGRRRWAAPASGPPRLDPSRYAGSAVCASCHPRQARLWRLSAHARMVRNPRRDPQAVLAVFEGNSPFPPGEIAYVLGSRNVQRFVSARGVDLVVRAPIWLVRPARWDLSYWRELDWLKSCAGCHTTGLDPVAGRYAEEGIGCEACHGPGRLHAASRRARDIVHPGRLGPRRRDMICESCHTTGHDATGEFRFPAGYLPGADLRQYYFGLTPRPGQDNRTFRGDGSYEDRHAQFLFWQSVMLLRQGQTCDLCKDFRSAHRGAEHEEETRMTSLEFCRSCHDGRVVPAPRHHAGPAVGRRHCLSCHPAARTASGDPSVHDHRYIPPDALPKNDFIPAPDFTSICFRCHPVPSEKGA